MSIPNPVPEILVACADNDVSRVIQLLGGNADVNAWIQSGQQTAFETELPGAQFGTFPLKIAAIKNDAVLADVLLAHSNVDTEQRDSEGATALFTACRQNHVSVAELLLKHTPLLANSSTDLCTTPLFESVRERNWACVELLLKQPLINVNYPDIRLKEEKVAWKFITQSALVYAVLTGSVKAQNLLLDHPKIKIDWAMREVVAKLRPGYWGYAFLQVAASRMLVKRSRFLSLAKLWCKEVMEAPLNKDMNMLMHVFATPKTPLKDPLECSRTYSALCSSLLSARDLAVLLQRNVIQITMTLQSEYAGISKIAQATNNPKSVYAQCAISGWSPSRHYLYPHARFRNVALLFMQWCDHFKKLQEHSVPNFPKEVWQHILYFVVPHDCVEFPPDAGGCPIIDELGTRIIDKV